MSLKLIIMRFISEKLFRMYFPNLIENILFYKALIERYKGVKCKSCEKDVYKYDRILISEYP